MATERAEQGEVEKDSILLQHYVLILWPLTMTHPKSITLCSQSGLFVIFSLNLLHGYAFVASIFSNAHLVRAP